MIQNINKYLIITSSFPKQYRSFCMQEIRKQHEEITSENYKFVLKKLPKSVNQKLTQTCGRIWNRKIRNQERLFITSGLDMFTENEAGCRNRLLFDQVQSPRGSGSVFSSDLQLHFDLYVPTTSPFTTQ